MGLKRTVGRGEFSPRDLLPRESKDGPDADRNHAGHSDSFHILLLMSRDGAIPWALMNGGAPGIARNESFSGRPG